MVNNKCLFLSGLGAPSGRPDASEVSGSALGDLVLAGEVGRNLLSLPEGETLLQLGNLVGHGVGKVGPLLGVVLHVEQHQL